MMDGTAAKGERIRASRGYYEAEVSCTGEIGLQQCLIMCQKNPGHKNFIPTNDFNIEHLPSRYQDKILVDYVKATSDLTCRLSVTDISKDRPETWPDSDRAFPFSAHKGENFMMAGTGWVRGVYRYTGNDKLICECDECRQPLSITQKKTWGIFYIRTACHVVYDNEEARHTKCQFFYDSPETNVREVLTLTGLKVVEKDVKADWCRMKFITHDEELLDKFYKMWWRWDDLRNKVYTKYMSPGVECDTDAKHDLCIVVSHPHGCTKQISVGNVTHRCVVCSSGNWREDIMYSYNTPTCPGSSGAPVITLAKDKRWPDALFHLPPHSQGQPGNDNNSGVGSEVVIPHFQRSLFMIKQDGICYTN